MPPNDSDPSRAAARRAAWALMFGNLVTGLAVLSPAGMMADLSAALGVTIQQTGLLITFGAVVLCLGSPLVAWATATMDRARLLNGTLALLAIMHAAAALSPNYTTLMVLRLIMLAVAAVFTPQAASAIALIVPERERASAISFVFLGWSLAVAIGLPLVTVLADHWGWRAPLVGLAVIAALTGAFSYAALPSGLRGTPLSASSWAAIARDRLLLLLLAITAVWVAGQFAVFPYVGPLLTALTGASASTIGAFFALVGVMGFIGNVLASRIVTSLGPFRCSMIFILVVLAGSVLWSIGAGSLPVMGCGLALFGLGSLALNSMQQARLVAAAPPLASATVALNTSALYVGQAVGSAMAGALFSSGHPVWTGYFAGAFVLIAFALLLLTRPRKAAGSSRSALPIARP